MGGHWRVSSGSGASAGATTSGESARGLGGSTRAGSTTLPFPARFGSSAGFATGCNACGRGLSNGDPRAPALPGSVWGARPKPLWPRASSATPGRTAPAVRRSSPEEGAGRLSAHVRICARDAQPCASQPQHSTCLGQGNAIREVAPQAREFIQEKGRRHRP